MSDNRQQDEGWEPLNISVGQALAFWSKDYATK